MHVEDDLILVEWPVLDDPDGHDACLCGGEACFVNQAERNRCILGARAVFQTAHDMKVSNALP